MQNKQLLAVVLILVISSVVAFQILNMPQANPLDVHSEHGEQHEEHQDEHQDPHQEDHVDPHGDEHNDAHDKGHEAAHKDGHDDSHDEHQPTVTMSPASLAQHQVRMDNATLAPFQQSLSFPGEISFNDNRIAHVIARLTGVVTGIHKQQGDRVAANELLAVLESRELTQLQGHYIAAKRREVLAGTILERETLMWQQKSLPELDYLRSRQALADAQNSRITYQLELSALGFNQVQIEQLGQQENIAACFEIRAPQAGTIIEKHLTLGEAVQPGDALFMLADTSNLWGRFTVYSQDLAAVSLGQEVHIRSLNGERMSLGQIDFLGQQADPQTQSVEARINIDNNKQQWRSGLYANFELVLMEPKGEAIHVVVATEAVHLHEGREVIFVHEGDDQFTVRPVSTGQRNSRQVEILAGLIPGESYAAVNSFLLKAELGKASASHQH